MSFSGCRRTVDGRVGEHAGPAADAHVVGDDAAEVVAHDGVARLPAGGGAAQPELDGVEVAGGAGGDGGQVGVDRPRARPGAAVRRSVSSRSARAEPSASLKSTTHSSSESSRRTSAYLWLQPDHEHRRLGGEGRDHGVEAAGGQHLAAGDEGAQDAGGEAVVDQGAAVGVRHPLLHRPAGGAVVHAARGVVGSGRVGDEQHPLAGALDGLVDEAGDEAEVVDALPVAVALHDDRGHHDRERLVGRRRGRRAAHRPAPAPRR